MEVLAVIKSVSQTMSKTREDGTVSSRKIVEFMIGDKPLHVTVFRGIDRYVAGKVGMLSYSISSEVRNSQQTGDPYVSYNVQIDSFRELGGQQSQDPTQEEVAAAFAESIL